MAESDDEKPDRPKIKETLPGASSFMDSLAGEEDVDIDDLLAKLAPDLVKEFSELDDDFDNVTISIESLDLDGTTPEEVRLTLKQRYQLLKKKIKAKAKELAIRLYHRLKLMALWLVFEAPKKILVGLKYLFGTLKKGYGVFSQWPLKRKILSVVAVVGIGLVSFLYLKVITSGVLQKDSFFYYGSMAQLADQSFVFEADGVMEPFYNSPRVKAYLFQLKPVVVNLKRRNPEQGNPMGFFEFVFEGSSGEIVVELQGRESEFVDITQRVIEDHYYESLDTREGKQMLKDDLRREMNRRLTGGVIRKVEIKNFFIKP